MNRRLLSLAKGNTWGRSKMQAVMAGFCRRKAMV